VQKVELDLVKTGTIWQAFKCAVIKMQFADTVLAPPNHADAQLCRRKAEQLPHLIMYTCLYNIMLFVEPQ
jgi:hypothetical protein